MKENLELDEASKKYLDTLYRELILNRNNLGSINMAREKNLKNKQKHNNLNE
jgi:hypothetical protein